MLLDGIRVIDLTTVVMGPLATRMLADMGADVIWIESPEGDVLRDYEPMRSPKMGAFSMSVSRNKRSVVLDLKTPVGQETMCELIATADVFVTNLRRKAIERLGLDEEKVRSLRPDIVYCMANGFGSDGPNADKTAYDDVIQAASGLASTFAWHGGEPRLVPSILADKVAGVHVAFAIAAALFDRARSGQGATLEVPMAETMAAFNLVEHLGGQTFRPQHGDFSYSRIRTPHRRPRRTTDGWIVVLPYSTENWHRFFDYAGQPELKHDDRFATGGERIKHSDELYGLLDDIIKERTTAEWLAFCAKNSIPASEVIDLEKIGEHPHFAAVGLLQDDEHPTEGPYRYVRDPIKVDGEVSPIRHHAPRHGADTEAVLRELGWDEDRIAALRPADTN
ncbi:MAG: CoA transferase [Woeseiaceae bacterium]|nr:CoA transferase [Woeseiaceae bacterium]NIP19533.1 CoA transferase [Woeseiaceae bacterium]NIS88488.1 CoA transferase [Woeseiaceae bacterium]